MSRATGRLLELGLLDRLDRGPGRPSEYRITSKLIELTERAESPETQRARIEHTPQAEQETSEEGARAQDTGGARSSRGGRANRAHVVRDRERTTTRESDNETTSPNPPDYVADGSTCVDCGGAVTTNPNKPSTPPNPRCKPCHDRHKRPNGRGGGPSWDHTTAPGYQYNSYGTPSR